MGEASSITDADIVAGWRAVHGDGAEPRVLKRTRLRPTAGLTASYFERVKLKLGDRKISAILKRGGLTFGPQVRERLFFESLSRDVRMRVPECYAAGECSETGYGWVLMEALPHGKHLIDWTDEETLTALRNLAALHAPYLGAPPPSLPRPFSQQLEDTLSYISEGVRMMRVRYDELPHMPRAASDRALDLLLRLAEHPEIFRQAFERSPETLLHGDYHRGNLLARDGEPQVAFDWQFVCAGPPAYDLAVFWLYLGAITKPGLFRIIDRSEVRDRSLTWQQVTDAYGAALRELRPDVDQDALFACEDAVIAWEAVRQATYFGHGMEPFMGFMRFVYRDHRTIGGWFARWLGLDQGGRIFADLFADFETRAERLLTSHGVPLP